jgi:hypothetical protein
MLGLDGTYANVQEVGALSAYATRVEDWIDRQNERYRAWFAAMDLAEVDRRLFASTGRSTQGFVKSHPPDPPRHLRAPGMYSNYPEMMLAVSPLSVARSTGSGVSARR